MTPFIKLSPSQRIVVEGYHPKCLKTDMEIVRGLLKTHFGAEAKIEKSPYLSHLPFSIYDFFIMATKALNAKLVVESGTGSGFSCGAFVTALKETEGVLYSIDKRPELENVKETIRRHTAQKDPVIFLHGDSVEIGKKWDKGNIDVLYCDSDHSYEYVLKELQIWGRFNPKITFVHDTLTAGRYSPHGCIAPPYQAAKEYAEKYEKVFVNLKFGVGLGILI